MKITKSNIAVLVCSIVLAAVNVYQLCLMQFDLYGSGIYAVKYILLTLSPILLYISFSAFCIVKLFTQNKTVLKAVAAVPIIATVGVVWGIVDHLATFWQVASFNMFMGRGEYIKLLLTDITYLFGGLLPLIWQVAFGIITVLIFINLFKPFISKKSAWIIAASFCATGFVIYCVYFLNVAFNLESLTAGALTRFLLSGILTTVITKYVSNLPMLVFALCTSELKNPEKQKS